MRKLEYAKERLNDLSDEMGNVQCFYIHDDKLMIELENGMNLSLSEEEVSYQASEFLQSELNRLR